MTRGIPLDTWPALFGGKVTPIMSFSTTSVIKGIDKEFHIAIKCEFEQNHPFETRVYTVPLSLHTDKAR